MIKTINSIPAADIKTFLGVPMASVKTIDGLAVVPAETGPIPTAGLGLWYQSNEGVYSQQAAQFTNGNSEYLNRPDSTSLRLGNIPFTIGGWVYLDGTMAAASVWIEKRLGADIDYEIYFDYATNQVHFIHGTGSVIPYGPVTLNAWNFIIIAHTPGAGATIQMNDGFISAATAATAPPITTGELTIGSSHSPLGNWLNGRQQNWFIFGRALNATERTFLYNAGNGRSYEELDSTFKTSLRAWWPLDEVSGSRRDLSGNNNTLTDNNTVGVGAGRVLNPPGVNGTPIKVWQDSGPNEFHLGVDAPAYSPTWQGNERNGKPVARFDGADDRMITAPILGSYLCAPQAQTVFVVQKNGSGASSTYNWAGEAVSNLNAHLPYGGSLYYDAGHYTTCRINVPNPEPWLNTWHLVEMYRDGSTGAILIEGVAPPGTVLALSGAFIDTHTAPMVVGGAGAAYFIQGDLAELIMYNRALSAAERDTVREYLTAKWFAPFSPADVADLSAWYAADSGARSQVAAQFTSANTEYLSIPTNASLQTTSAPMTVGCWYFQDTDLSVSMFGCKSADGTQVDWQFYAEAVNQKILFQGYNGTSHLWVGAPKGPIGQWHFAVGWYDPAGGGITNVQVDDGTPASGAIGTLINRTDGGFMVGANTWNAPAVPHNGRLQNFFLFGRILSAAERTFLYNGGVGRSYEELDAAFKTDLRGWWPLDEASGSRRDLSGNNNTLTDNNTVTYNVGKVPNPPSADNALITDWRDLGPNALDLTCLPADLYRAPEWQAGEQNGKPVVRFNGTTPHALTREAVVGGLLSTTDAITIFLVMKTADISSAQFQWGTGASNIGIYMPLGGLMYFDHGLARFTVAEPPGFLGPCHVIETWRSGTAMEIVLDGGTPYASPFAATLDTAQSSRFRLGADTAFTSALSGDIAELIFYRRALTADERANVRAHLMAKYGV